MKDLDKDKLKKAGIWLIVYLVIFTAIEITAAVWKHNTFHPKSIITIIVAAILCAITTVYIPRLKSR